jgi:hypothetical protein
MSDDNQQPTMGEQAVNDVVNPALADVPADLSSRTAPQLDAAQPQQQFPPSPDQPGGQNPIQGTSDDVSAANAGRGSLWRNIVLGALSGVKNHLEAAGKGALVGGIPGAIVGAANPKMADTAFKQQQQMRQNAVTASTAHAQSELQQVAWAKDNHDLQMALAQTNLAMLNRQFDMLPADFQEHLVQEGAEAGQHLIAEGIAPVFNGSEADAIAQQRARMQVNANNSLGVVALPDGKGNFNVFEVPNNNKILRVPTTVTIGYQSDGTPITKDFPADSLTVGQRLAIETAALNDQSKALIQNQKNAGSANVANIKAQSAATRAIAVGKDSVVGFDPQTNERIVVNADDPRAANLQQSSKVKASQVDNWGTSQNQFANVQLAVSRYDQAAKEFAKSGKPGDIVGINSALNKAGVGDIQIGEWGVRVPGFSSVAEAASRVANSAAFKSLSPAGQDLVDKYFRMMSSIPEYQKAATGIGRTNKEMLDLELKNIPDPTMPPSIISNRLGSFQEALTSNAARVPHINGIPSAKEVIAHYGHLNAAPPSQASPSDAAGIADLVRNVK